MRWAIFGAMLYLAFELGTAAVVAHTVASADGELWNKIAAAVAPAR